MILADAFVDFASSPAGYITGIGTPIIIGLLVYIFRQQDKRITQLEKENKTRDELQNKTANTLGLVAERLTNHADQADRRMDRLEGKVWPQQ